MPRVVLTTLAVLCAALPVRGQVRVTGVVRDSAGLPVGGALVTVDLGLGGMTFTHPDGRFALPKTVPQTSWIRILHLATDAIDTLVSTLAPASANARGAFASVTLRNRPLDSVAVSAEPPFRITSRAPDDVELELVDRAAGLERLRRSSGYREIRAYVHGRDGVVVLRRHGGHVSGEVWLWWIVGPRSALFEIVDIRLRAAAYGCGTVPFHWATVADDSLGTWRLVLACRPPFSTTPDWKGLWSRLDSLDVWRLSDETFYQRGGPPLVGQMPGSVVSLRLFDGRCYRLVRQGDRIYKTTPWGMRGLALEAALNDAFGSLLLRPSRMERRVHTVGIRGVVRDTAGHPLAGALVTVPALPTSARTADDGRFQLQHPVPWSVFIGVQHPGHQGVSYRVGGLPGQSHDSLGYETTIVLRPDGDRDSVSIYRSWPRCAEWDAFADRVAGSLVDVPEARLVTDPAVCAMAGMAYAGAERDPIRSEGRQVERGDIALGMRVYVFQVNGGYVVFDEYNRVDGFAIGWAFDARLQKPWKRRRV
jgi:carboxypeptidase family protein